MANHIKPTKEEIQANIEKDLKEIEKPVETPVEETPEPPIIPDAPIEETPDPEPSKEEKEEIKEQKEIDYKKRFVESTREAQILHAKDKKINEAIEEAKKLDITDDDVQKEYPDWELMSDTEKKLARNDVLNKKRFDMLEKVTEESKNITVWHEKVDTFADDPKTLIDNPDLEGKIDEFKIFATKSSRRGVDFDTLVSSFLWTEEKTKLKNKGAMFPTSTGGQKGKPQVSDKISMEQAKTLRDTNYNEYKRLLRENKIEMDPDK